MNILSGGLLRSQAKGLAVLFAAAVLTSGSAANASTWSGADGNWSSNVSPGWNTTGPPNAVGAIADNPISATGKTTQDVGATQTVGTISLTGAGDFAWTIAGLAPLTTNTITLNQDGGGAGAATILNADAATGSINALILSANLVLADNLLISNTGGSTNGTGAIQISGIMSGTVGGVTFSNSSLSPTLGYIRLSGANTFTAPVLIQKGITQITTATGLGNAANIVTLGQAGQGSAVLTCSASVNVANPIVVASGSGGTLALGGGTGTTNYSGTITLNDTLYLATNSTNVAGTLYSGLISGAGGLILPAGTGNVRLNNVNSSFTGGVTLQGGTLNINNSTDTTDPNTYTKGPLGKGTLTLSGGKIDTNSSGAANTIANPIAVTAATTTAITSITNNITFNGPITGSGTLKFDSALVASHTTTISLGGSLAGFSGTIEHYAYDTSSGGTGNAQANTLVLQGAAADASTVKFNLHGVQNRNSGGRGVRFDATTGGGSGIAKMGELAGDGGFILATNGPVNLEVGALNTPSTTYAGGFGDIGSSVLSLTKVGTGELTLTNVQSYNTGTTTVRSGGLIVTQAVDSVALGGQLAISSVNTGTETITAGVAHQLSAGDTIKFGNEVGGATESTLYYVIAAGLTATDFRVSTSPGGSAINVTSLGTSPNFYHVATLGGASSAIQLGDAGSTTADPITLRMDAGKTFSRPISVNATTGASTTTIGGGTDADSKFAGAIALAKDLSITSAATSSNSVNISGAITGPGFGITTVGGGNVTFSANNTYGGTTISSGTLIIGAGGATGTLGSGTVTNSGALVFNRNNAMTVANAISGSGTLEQRGSGTTSLTSANSYLGDTTVTAGTLTLDHSGGNLGSLGNTAVTVTGASTLLVKGSTNIGTGAGGVLSLASTGVLDMRDSAINTLTTGGSLVLDSSVLHMNLGSTNGANDLISVGASGSTFVSGTTTLNLYALSSLASGSTSYTLISAPSGGLNAGGAGFNLGVVPAGFNTYNLSSSTTTALILSVTANATPGTAYWSGKASTTGSPTDPSNNWGYGSALTTPMSNWSTTANGLNDALQVPGQTTNVFFAASNVTDTVLNTQLDSIYGINSLTFNTSSAASVTDVGIDTNSNALTIGSGGLTVASADTSNTTISGAGQVLIGASQNWANNSATKSLTVSANVNGTAVGGTQTLTLNGTGAAGATLSGAIGDGTGLGGQLALAFGQSGTTVVAGNNTFTGGVTINGGTVQVNNPGALNSTTPNAVAFGPASTGVLQLNGNTLTIGGFGTNASVGTPIVENANASAATLTVSVASGTNTYAGVLQDGSGGGALSLTKSGAGTLALTGTNTYTGSTTTVSGGVLRATEGAGLPAATGVTLSGGVWETDTNIARANGAGSGEVQLTSGASGFSAHGAPVSVNLGGGGATLTWGSSTFDPSALVLNESTADNTLDFQNGIDLNGTNRTITVNSAGNAAKISGVISGAAGISKGGAGTLILAAANTFTGATGSSGGLQLNDSLALQNSTVTGTGIIFDQSVASNQFTFGQLSAGTTLALQNNAGSPAPITLFVGSNNANTTTNTVLTGAGSLVKNGTGSIQFNSASTHTGGTTLNAGTMNLRFGTDTADPNTYTNGPVGKGLLTLNGGTLSNITGAVILANPVNVTANTTVNSASDANFLTLTGPITGTARITTSNNTTVTAFTGDISGFSGQFRVTGATSRIQFLGNTAASLDGSQAKFSADTSAGGQFRFGVSGIYNNPTIMMGSLTGTAAASLVVANGQIGKTTFEIGALGQSDSFSGSILSNSGTNVSITKVGVGTLTFGAATPTNTDVGSSYTGTTDISNGTFKAGNATALGFNTFEGANATRGNAYGASVPTAQTTTAGTNVTGTGTLDLNGLTFNEVITLSSNGIAGIGGLINSNTSTAATVSNGVAFIQINSGGSGYTGTSPTIGLSGGGGGAGAAVIADTTGAVPLSLGLTTASVSSVSGGSGFAINDVISLTGTQSGASALAKVTSIGGTGNITGISVTNAGNGFTAASTISGVTIVSSATGSTTGVTVGLNSSNFIVSSLKLSANGSGYTSAPAIGITGGGATTDATATALLSEVKLAGDSSIGGDGQLNIDAVVSGGFGLTKVGAGTTNMSGANTYSGNTTISTGTLALTGSGSFASSPAIQVDNGATLNVSGVTGGANHNGSTFSLISGQTLKGNGAVVGAAGVAAGATVAPGNSIGALATQDLTFAASTSTLGLEIDLAGLMNADLLTVAGTMTLASTTLNLSLLNAPSSLASTTFLVVDNDAADPVSGTFAPISGLPSGYSALLDYAFTGTDALGRTGDGNDIAITIQGGLSGNYNSDNKVNAADFVTWRKNPSGNGGDPDGYGTWRQNFGNSSSSATSLNAVTGVPEPSTYFLAVVSVLGLMFTGRAARKQR